MPNIIPKADVNNEILFLSAAIVQNVISIGMLNRAMLASRIVMRSILRGRIGIAPFPNLGFRKILAIMIGKKDLTPLRNVHVFGIRARHQNQIQPITAIRPSVELATGGQAEGDAKVIVVAT